MLYLSIFPIVPLLSLLVCLSHLKTGGTIGPSNFLADCPGSHHSYIIVRHHNTWSAWEPLRQCTSFQNLYFEGHASNSTALCNDLCHILCCDRWNIQSRILREQTFTLTCYTLWIKNNDSTRKFHSPEFALETPWSMDEFCWRSPFFLKPPTNQLVPNHTYFKGINQAQFIKEKEKRLLLHVNYRTC